MNKPVIASARAGMKIQGILGPWGGAVLPQTELPFL
jgi:hypothetical protein